MQAASCRRRLPKKSHSHPRILTMRPGPRDIENEWIGGSLRSEAMDSGVHPNRDVGGMESSAIRPCSRDGGSIINQALMAMTGYSRSRTERKEESATPFAMHMQQKKNRMTRTTLPMMTSA